MSAEVIILIVGGILILLSLVDSIMLKDSSKSLINPNLRAPLGILGILLMIYGGYSYGAVNLQGNIELASIGNKKKIDLPVKNVQVISPLEGDLVNCRILTMGVYPSAHEKDIWVVLRPSDDRYYPQSDHTNTSYKRNGEWQVITRFGGDKDESYDLIVYEADASASQYFSTTIENWKSLDVYPGLKLEELPTGAKEIERIVVSLKDNCRGIH